MIQLFQQNQIPPDFLEALRLLMNYGFLKKKEIWDWAVHSIETYDNYDLLLLELIEGAEPDAREIDFSIKRRTENYDTHNSFRVLISFVSRYLSIKKLSPVEAASKINVLCRQLEINLLDKEQLYYYDYNLYLANENIIGDSKEIVNDLKKTIKVYEQLQLNNYRNWPTINLSIDTYLNSFSQS